MAGGRNESAANMAGGRNESAARCKPRVEVEEEFRMRLQAPSRCSTEITHSRNYSMSSRVRPHLRRLVEIVMIRFVVVVVVVAPAVDLGC